MSAAERFRDYAAECICKAEDAVTTEDKTLLLNMGLAWVRLAQQVESIATMDGEARDLGLTSSDDASLLVAESEQA
jgi:hypothetical protein